jgi:DNA-binding MarR family transcriptional regulator
MPDDEQRDPPEVLVGMPSWLLARAAREGHRLVDAALAGDGLRRYDFSVLTAVAEGGPPSQTDLVRRLGIDASDVAAVVAALEARGWVVRRRDEADRRRKVVALTPEGRVMTRRLVRRVEVAQDTLLAGLEADERRTLVELLRRVGGRPTAQAG